MTVPASTVSELGAGGNSTSDPELGYPRLLFALERIAYGSIRGQGVKVSTRSRSLGIVFHFPASHLHVARERHRAP